MCFFTLSVISIVLGFALFTRIESVARDLRTMDTKFSLQIQQIRDILKESSASSRGSKKTLTHQMVGWLRTYSELFLPNFVLVYMLSFI